MFPRHARQQVLDALSDTPVVLIHGPRQSGKSTLAESVSAGDSPRTKVTLDDPLALALAKRDPQAFLETYRPPVLIDEVQRAPELFLPIKLSVDRDRRAGKFLLTGSANVLSLPKLADSLAGRMEVVDLLPLSQSELESRPAQFVDTLFEERCEPGFAPVTPEDVVSRILRGGFPEAVTRTSQNRREAWFANYVRTLLDRDVKDLANIEALAQMPHLLNLLASRSGAVLNASSLATDTGIPYTSLRRYLNLLESIFLLRLVNAWSSNRSKVFTKAPKAYLGDTGLLCYLAHLDARAMTSDPLRFGMALESLVANELAKECLASRTKPWLMHLRTIRHLQVDFVLESRRGEVVGLQIKAGNSLHADDANGLRFLRELAGPKFRRGVVLYLGDEVRPLDAGIVGIPLGALWGR